MQDENYISNKNANGFYPHNLLTQVNHYKENQIYLQKFEIILHNIKLFEYVHLHK